MEVSAQLDKVCIGSATALGKRPDQQVGTAGFNTWFAYGCCRYVSAVPEPVCPPHSC